MEVKLLRRKVRGKTQETWTADLRTVGGGRQNTGETDHGEAKRVAMALAYDAMKRTRGRLKKAKRGAVPLVDAVDAWGESRELHEVVRWEDDLKVVKRFAAWAGGVVSDIDAQLIRRWLNEDRADVGLSTQKRNVSKISVFLQWAEGEGHFDSHWVNPVAGVRFPKRVGALVRKDGLSRDELSALLDRVEGHPQLEPAIALAYFGGVEQSAMAAMTWGDVGWDDNTLRVPCKKNGTRDRRIPLLAELRQRLVTLRRADGPIIPKSRADANPHFSPAALTQLRIHWNREHPEVSPVPGFHLGRHTIAGLLLRAGVPIYDVSRYLGHSSVKTTEAYYAHHVSSVDRRANLDLWRF